MVSTEPAAGQSAYVWLEGSQKPDRKMASRGTLRGRVLALSGSVWPLHDGIHELEVVTAPDGPKQGKGMGGGKGNGTKVIIRERLKVGPS